MSEKTELRPYPSESPTELGPWLLTIALALMVIDALVMLWLAGALRFSRGGVAVAIALLIIVPDAAHADTHDQAAVEAVSSTRLAYVMTGNSEIDAASHAGLAGLSMVLAQRTALEPGEPAGIDPSKDELSFYPIIYWPVDASIAAPTDGTMARIDAYMRQGGSVLFDTRDHLERSGNIGAFIGTPAVERLREILASLDIPPLEPVPANHVLTKAFYLLNDFPGRYSGGPLWVEATQASDRSDRPAQAGDGVSTILITENDFAAAWAMDAEGRYLYPTIPTDPLQREMAFRTGVNIVMYTLTGNYKADQVHIPALLERLGQ